MIPQFLIEMFQSQYGEEITKNILDGFSKKRVVTFRVNTIKADTKKVEDELKAAGIEFEKPKWSNKAFIVKNITEKEIQ